VLAPGSILDGKYEIVGLLGAGGMGEVYQARHVHLGTIRCIKVMKPALMADEVYCQRFLREARLATQIQHPNLAVVHDFAMPPDGASYMVTEFIDGTTVRQWQTANGRFPLALATEVTMQVLAGLDLLHRRGLLHRDISADNVMLSFDPGEHLVVKIIDLGVAKDVSTTADTTQAGVLMGNPKYMSPEQLGELAEGDSLDGRADLYSLGVVLYEMLVGVPPFLARTPSGYIVKHLTEPPRTFAEANASLEFPDGLEAVVLRALEKDRANRWANARAFAEALVPFAAPTPRAFSRTSAPPLRDERQISTDDQRAEEAWASALAANTYAAFRDYRARFPQWHADEAERALEERLAFDAAAAIDTEDAWTDYLERFGSDRHAAAATERLDAVRGREETAFSVAVEMKSAAAWRAYLEEFPDGHRSAVAEQHLREELDYANARKSDAIETWNAFLRAWPEGLHEYDARERLAALEKENDERSWRAASGAKTAGAMQAYLHAHPDGQWIGEARRILGHLAVVEGDFDASWEKGTTAAWDEYLARYPDAPRAEEARRCRQEAAEYEMAAQMNTKVMWRAFLKAWPGGRHQLDAEVRLRG
jgi:tRNA A-37 threonylcarbamoyl transferase component Bud32